MTVTQYIPLSAALMDIYQFVDPSVESEADLLDWAFIAFRKLQVRQTYAEKIAVLAVDEHKACLPADTRYIEQMFYREDLVDNSLPQIALTHGTATGDTSKYLTFESSLMHFNQTWKPLRAASSIFNNAVHCENSINLYNQCDATYSVGKAGDITTSFSSGYIALGYLAYPTHDGEFLVPDDEEVLEAIKDFVLSRVWERRMNYGVDGAAVMWERYLRQFELRAAKSRGKLLLLSLDQWQNFQDQMVRIGRHTQSYNFAFGNLATQEKVVYSHIF